MSNSTPGILDVTTEQLGDGEHTENLLLFAMLSFKKVVSFCGLFGNGFMLLLYWKYKELRALKPICSLMCLAFADMVRLGGDFVIMMALWLNPTIWHMTGFECLWFWAPAILGSYVSLIYTVYVALERFAALYYPLRFRTSDIKRNAVHASVVAWIFSFVINYIAAFKMKSMWELLGPGGCFIPFLVPAWTWAMAALVKHVELVVCLTLYIFIFVKARRQLNSTVPATDTQAALLTKRERRLTQATMQVLTIYLLCIIVPSLLMFIVPLIVGKVTPEIQEILIESNGVGSAINSSVNVLIYVFKCDEIKFHARKFIGKIDANKSFGTGTTPISALKSTNKAAWG